MSQCSWEDKVEAYFDNELPQASEFERHLAQCGECSEYMQYLKAIRGHAEARREVRGIEDAHFNAFMEGIREGIEAPAHSSRGFWALMSLVTAALVVSLAVFSMFTGPAPVKATDVESISTDLEGVTVDVDTAGDITTISIVPPQRYKEDIQ